MTHPSLERVMANARMRLPGAIDDAIQYELFAALDEFLKGSDAWQEEVTFKVTPGKKEYDIFLVRGAIVRLLKVTSSDGRVIRWASMPVPGVVHLRDDPPAEDTYTALVSVTVNDPTTKDGDPEYPHWVLERYHTEVLEGVLARMMAQPAKPYSNTTLAVYHARRFRNFIAQARVDVSHAHLQGAQRWAFPQSFATGRR